MVDHVPVSDVVLFEEYSKEVERLRKQREALRLARTIALACLPKRRTKQRDLVRILRLGSTSWVKVTYSAPVDGELPFGDDRFVLAGVIHLAIQNRSPMVDFGTAGALLKMFDINRGERAYQLLRERFQRLEGLAISIKMTASREALDDPKAEYRVKREFVFMDSALPSNQELRDGTADEIQLPLFTYNELEGCDIPRYGVVLSPQTWSFIKDPKQQFLVPIHLLKHFVNNPTGWDYLVFLVHRCGSAQSTSKVPHDALMHLFKDCEDEPDRKVINRLKRVHAQIMHLTDSKLNADLVEDGLFPKQGRGRRKKRWCLKVGPSQPLIPPRPSIKP